MKQKNRKRVRSVFIAFFAIILLFFVFFCFFFTFFPQKYKKIIKIECEKYNLEPALICAIINAESRFDKTAQSDTTYQYYIEIIFENQKSNSNNVTITTPQNNTVYGTIKNLINAW